MPLAVLASDAPPKSKLLILALFHHDWDGSRAWPSQERLGKIMSLSRETVAEAVKDCVGRGWLVVKKRFSKTSVYEISIPDMNLHQFEEAIGGEPFKLHLSENPTKALCRKIRHPLSEKSTLTENKEAEPVLENGSLKHRAAIGLFKRPWGERYQENYTPTPIDHRKLKELLKEEVLPAEFSARLKGYLASNEQFVAGQRHSLSLFISQFNKWPLIDEGPDVPKLVI